SRPESFEQRVSTIYELERKLGTFAALQIDRHRAAAAVEQIVLGLGVDAEVRVLGAIEPQHFGSHVREQHRAHRSGPHGCGLDDLVAEQTSHGRRLLLVNWYGGSPATVKGWMRPCAARGSKKAAGRTLGPSRRKGLIAI